MANNAGDKLPVEIVTTVIDKIADFTRETEVLRSQIPTKESIEALNSKVDRATLTIKIFFGAIGVIIALSLFGAQIIDWTKSSSKPETVSQQVLDNALKAQRDEYAKQLESFQKQIMEDIKKLHESDESSSK